MDDLAFKYQQDRDKIADEQWQKEFAEAQRQFNKQMSLKSGGSGGGSSGKKSSGSSGKSSATTVAKEPTVEEEYLALKKSGAGARELDSMLKAAIAEGKISQWDATELRNKRY